jgi:predicted  nucleic acid-binding Zn-ribbon protein
VGLRKRRSDGEGEDTSDMYAVELEDDAADAHEQRNKIRQEFASIETSVAAAEARVREAEAQVDDSLVYSTPGTPKRSGMGATF